MQAEVAHLEWMPQLRCAFSSVGGFPLPLLTPDPLSHRRRYASCTTFQGAFAAHSNHREVLEFDLFAHGSKTTLEELSLSALASKADFAQ